MHRFRGIDSRVFARSGLLHSAAARQGIPWSNSRTRIYGVRDAVARPHETTSLRGAALSFGLVGWRVVSQQWRLFRFRLCNRSANRRATTRHPERIAPVAGSAPGSLCIFRYCKLSTVGVPVSVRADSRCVTASGIFIGFPNWARTSAAQVSDILKRPVTPRWR